MKVASYEEIPKRGHTQNLNGANLGVSIFCTRLNDLHRFMECDQRGNPSQIDSAAERANFVISFFLFGPLDNPKNPLAHCCQEQATRTKSEPIRDHPAAYQWLQGLTMHILFPFKSVFCNLVLTRSPLGEVWYSLTSSSTISSTVQPFEAFESRVEEGTCRQYPFRKMQMGSRKRRTH